MLWVYDEFTDNETGDGAKQAAVIVWQALHDCAFEGTEKSWIFDMMAEYAIQSQCDGVSDLLAC